MYFKPKNKEIENIFDRLVKYPAASIDTQLARNLSRYNKIKYLRDIDNIYFGLDRNKHKSIVFIPHTVKIQKKNGKFYFSYK